MRVGGRMRMGAQASPHTPLLAPWRFLLLWRSCCLGDVAGCGLKRRRTIGLKGGVEGKQRSDHRACRPQGGVGRSESVRPTPRGPRVAVRRASCSRCPAPFDLCRSVRSLVSLKALMHLLVLSAFRPLLLGALLVAGFVSQCTFWCSVLSDGRRSSRMRML